MRTVNPLKYFYVLCLSLLFFGVQAQQKSEYKAPFVRIYSPEGKKILKGRVAGVSDYTISLTRGGEIRELNISEIGFIRTKHSIGNNILIGALASSVFFASVTAADADPDAWIFSYTPAEGALIGLIAGAPVGGIIGLITAIFKRSEQYDINGQQEAWMKIMPNFQR